MASWFSLRIFWLVINAAVRIRNSFAREIDQNFKTQLFRLFALRRADDGKLRLALLHSDHAKVRCPDDPKTHIPLGIETDISEPQAHGEVRRSGGRMVRADFTLEIFDAFNCRRGDQVIGEKYFEAHDHRSIGAAYPRACHRRSGAGDHLKLTGEERHQSLGRALDVDHIDVKAVLFEDPCVFCNPQHRGRSGVGRDVGKIQPLIGAEDVVKQASDSIARITEFIRRTDLPFAVSLPLP